MSGRTLKLAGALLLSCCTVVTASLAPPAFAARAANIAPAAMLGGINTDFQGSGSEAAQADRAIAQALALHAKVIRTELQWAAVEPNAPGVVEPQALAYSDRLLSDAAAHHIAVVMMIDVTPCWASSAPSALLGACVPTDRGEANSYPPAQPSDFAAFARMIAARYGNEITALEVWNEPDQINEKYFAGPEKAVRYAALLRAAYPAIKEVDPHIQVLAGSLVGSNGVFLRLLYKAGIKGFYDGLSVHYYTLTLAAIRAVHAAQLENGDTTPLWLDEFGWGDCYPRLKIEEEQDCVTPAVQAQNISNVFRALRSSGYVAAATLYDLQDSGGDSFGVLTSNGVRKPSFSALSRTLASAGTTQTPVTLRVRRTGSSLTASGSGPVGDYMQLEAFAGRTLRYRATFTLDRSNRYSITLPSVLGTHHLRVRVYQWWGGLRRAAQRSV
jgi:hypothetical protein